MPDIAKIGETAVGSIAKVGPSAIANIASIATGTWPAAGGGGGGGGSTVSTGTYGMKRQHRLMLQDYFLVIKEHHS